MCRLPEILTVIRSALCLAIGLAVLSAGAEEKKPGLAGAKAEFAKADRELNEAWTAVKKALPEKQFSELKDVQREWIKYREDQTELTSGKPASYTAATALTTDRVQWLLARARNQEDPLTGVWFDGRGGIVEIAEQPGRLLFVFQVVRGTSFDLGRLAGVAAWNVNIGWFSDKGRDKEKTDETNISFTHRDLALEVIGAKTNYYHGQRAYFDGIYFKASSLGSKEQGEVIKAAESGKVPED